jgi:solute:Na+ symporter, SSS family
MQLAARADLVIVVLYLLTMIGIGVVMSFFNKDDSDFFRGGNKMPWWLAGVSMFMSMFSVYTFTGAAGLAFRSPGVAFLLYFLNGVGYLIGFLYLASRWRRSRSSTIFSYMTERYGLATNQVYSWVGLAASIVQSGVMLLALAKFISVAVGTDLTSTIVVCGAVIAVYCLIGGLWAVVVTDTLQFMVIFPCAIITMWLGIDAIGGVDVLFAQIATWTVPDSGVDMSGNAWSYGWKFVTAYGVMMIFASSSGIAAQRYFSVKNEKEAKKVALIGLVLLTIAPVIWLLPPVCAQILGLDLNFVSETLHMHAPEEAAYVVFCLKYLPVGAMGIILSAMLSATMSSLSSNFNAFAAVITDDIVKQLIWKKASSKALLVVGRIMTLLLGGLVIIAAVIMSEHPGGIFQLMLDFSGVVIIPAGIPIVMGLFYKPTPWWSGIACYLTGVVVGVSALYFDLSITFGGWSLLSSPPTFEQQIFTIGTLSAIVYMVPGLLIKIKGGYAERLNAFFTKLDTPVSEAEVGDSESTDVGSYRVTGWTTVGMGVAVSALSLLNLPLTGRMINLSIGLLMAAFGLGLIWMCKVGVNRARQNKNNPIQ